jgi:hypothetical protein
MSQRKILPLALIGVALRPGTGATSTAARGPAVGAINGSARPQRGSRLPHVAQISRFPIFWHSDPTPVG